MVDRRSPQQVVTSFDAFWDAYPRKTAKGEARKAWSQLNPSEAMLAKMIAALAWQSETEQWTKDDGQWIPHPATWLRREQWEDEPVKKRTFRPHVVSTRDWRDECDLMHGGGCTNVHFHEAKKYA